MVWSAAATVSRFAALLATEIRLPLSVAAAAASVSFTGRRRFGPVAASLSTSVAGQADRGHQYAFQKDYYFFLPRNRTVFDINIEAFGEAVGDALMQMKRTQIMMLLFLFYASKCTNSLSCNLMYNCRLAELTTSRSMDLQSSLNFTSMDTLAALS